ncbi:unnamed protein product [Cylicocyclus nassatus]|uniref:Uncharacterized protein n=1 Tax=Cylicocyclus nassatus TaxID=53992 RepID=A0AA36GS59_CYLNA|nr:unnamed protein product [Cylicocyclus nassatus]
MSQEFASIYKSCREWLALTRFVAKGIVKPSTPSPNPARSPAEEKEILPPPPPPPTFHKKVDLSEYKERTKSMGPSSERASAERSAPRRSFIPDTSQARPDLSMPNLALPGQEPITPSPLATQPHENGHKSRDEHSRREEERRREKERRRREERERHGHVERPEERERRKREHERMSGGAPHPPVEKRPRHEMPPSSAPSSMGSTNVGNGSKPPRPMTQVQPSVHHSSSHPHGLNSANGSHSRRENDVLKNSAQYVRAMEPPRALSPPPLPPSVLPPPPPPPAAISELEEGEVE